MADEITGKAVSLVELDLDLYRATQFEGVRNAEKIDDFTAIKLRFRGTDAATAIVDHSSRPKQFTAAGNAQIDTADSKFGSSSGLFDGTGDYYTTPAHVDFRLGDSDFTVACWFKCNAAGGTSRRIAGQVSAGFVAATSTWAIYRETTNTLRCFVCIGPVFYIVDSTTQFTNAVNTGWHHVAMVRTGNTLKLFIDGVQEGGDVSASGTVNSSTAVLGIASLGDYTGEPWLGWLDEFSFDVGIACWTANFIPPKEFYVSLLLDMDVYQNSLVTFIDKSGNNRTITTNGNAVIDTADVKYGDGALLCDGAGDYISMPASIDFNLGADDFTIELWFKCADTGGAIVSPAGQINAAGGANADSSWYIEKIATNVMRFTLVSSVAITAITGSTDFTDLINIGWHHFAVVRIGNILRMFIDGRQEGGDVAFVGTVNTSASILALGRPGNFNGQYWNGRIDDFRLVKGKAMYTGTFTPPTRAHTTYLDPPKNWTPHWTGGRNILLSGVTDDDMPSGRALRVSKFLNDAAGSFIKWDLVQGLHDVSAIALFRELPPNTVLDGSSTGHGIVVRGEILANTGYRCRVVNNQTLEISKLVANVFTSLATVDFTITQGVDFWILFEVAGIAGGGTQLRAKAWLGERNDEPSEFTLTATEVSASIPSSGNAGYVGISIPGSIAYSDLVCGYFRARSIFAYQEETLRFAVPASYVPIEFDAIPNITSIDQVPVTLSLGETLGQRAQCTISFRDHKHADLGEFFNNGTHWGRIRGKELWRRGRSSRVRTGLLAHDLADYETRNYFTESFNGPTQDDQFSIMCQDVLKLADNDKSQAPVLNNGFLSADITSVATTAQLLPAGIGEEYATSGYLAIGGKEIVSFIRSGESLTIARAQFGTTAVAHSSEDRVQQCLIYTSQKASQILYDLLVTYAGVDAALTALTTWDLEVDTYLQRNYTRCIAEPTGVNQLLTELVQQAGLIVWFDVVLNVVRLQVLRGISTTAFEYNEDNSIASSIKVDEQRNKLITEAWVYYGVRNPLEPLDQANNYRSALAVPNLEAATLNGQSVIKKTFGSWIPTFARDTADRVTDLFLGRFEVPPRKVSFAIPRHSGIEQPTEAGGYQFRYRGSQDELGTEVSFPIQVIKITPTVDKLIVEAEEMLFTAFSADDLVNRVVTIDGNVSDFNLQTAHDSIYPPITADDVIASPPVTLTCIVNSGVVVSSTSSATPAFTVGTFVSGLVPTIQVIGRIQGMGGTGADVVAGGALTVGDGGTALYTRQHINLELSSGVAQIWGGGGGGGYFNSGSGLCPGGGGAGSLGGLAGNTVSALDVAPQAGTSEVGGAGGHVPGSASNGSTGGGPGLVGSNGGGGPGFGPGGAAGKAVDGISYVNIVSGYGDIRGTQVN